MHWFDCAVIEYAYMFARGYVWVCMRAVSYLGKRTRCRDTMNTSFLVSICLLCWL